MPDRQPRPYVGQRPLGQVAAGIVTLTLSAARLEPPQPQAPHQPIGSAEPGFVRRCGQPRQAFARASRTDAGASPRNATLAKAFAYRQTFPRLHVARDSAAVILGALGAAGTTGSGRSVPGGACGPM